MKKLTIYGIAFIFCLGLGGCNEWFDVKPKRLTVESELFSDEEGFKEALTGVYIKAATDNLYGKRLTYGFIDMLAQQYSGYSQKEYYDFSTSNTTTNGDLSIIWSEMYNLIANINNLLWWIEERKDVLTTPTYYEIIKGEALALRSYFYFDLLRLFGPIYSQNPTARTIPYRTQFNRDIVDLENADVLLEKILADLIEAHNLLDGADNLNFEYVNDNVAKKGPNAGEDAFLIFRYKRMNLLAVKALLARINLYKGDKVTAAAFANEVIASGKFRILSTMKPTVREPVGELIFGLHYNEVNNRDNKMHPGTHKIQSKSVFDEIFQVSTYGLNDIRVRESSGFVDELDNFYSLKYLVTGVVDGLQHTVPMLKLSEMYYIAAECTDNLTEARNLIDEVRTTRGLELLPELISDEQRVAELEIEYRKDFYAEGQLWYFFKRHFYKTFYGCPLESMSDVNYIFQIPDDEFLFGGISQ